MPQSRQKTEAPRLTRREEDARPDSRETADSVVNMRPSLSFRPPFSKLTRPLGRSSLQKKQTPLHLAASAGQESVSALLMELGASLDSTDDYGQKPIHLAAQSNKPEVVKLFLKQRPQLVSVTTKVETFLTMRPEVRRAIENDSLAFSMQDGSTCAHIAASKGSVSVLKELMKFDKSVVISSRNRITDSTPLHIATEGGHYDVVKMLMDAGASASDENKVTMRVVVG